MGAADFSVTVEGDTAAEAFREAVNSAQYEYGHRGYTGTIAEKTSFITVQMDPRDVEDCDRWPDEVQDKWGPAGAIKLDDDKWLFFGIASS